MTVVEVILILIGIAFVIVSFFVEEKLSTKDVERMEQLSEKELSVIVERQMREAEEQIEEKVQQKAEESAEQINLKLQTKADDAIMSIDEFAGNSIDKMNKTHEEIVFLYSMLNDKHSELTDLAGQMHRFSEQIRRTEYEVLQSLENATDKATASLAEVAEETEAPANETANSAEELAKPQAEEQQEEDAFALMEEEAASSAMDNHNQAIIRLRKDGLSDVEIAKQLGLGLGEVRLVLGLYKTNY